MLGILQERSTEEEIMDNFQGTTNELEMVFNDINRVNRLLGGNGITVKAVAQLIRDSPRESYVIVDVGCGDGSMLRQLADYCRKQHLKSDFIGIDLSSEALGIARKATVDYPEIRYLQQDILQLAQADLDCDILISSLTTHHFSNEQLPVMLAQFAKLPKIGFVNNDLHRSRVALILFKMFSLVFIKTATARVDGLISIKSGFKKKELQHFAKQLPHMHHFITWKWAFRYVWIMKPKQPIS